MSEKQREWVRTLLGVIIIVFIAIGATALYDNFSGGPQARESSEQARESSENSEEILRALNKVFERNECVVTYTNAENVAEATLLVTIGSLVETSAATEEDTIAQDPRIYQEQLQELHAANEQFLVYLSLLTQTNQLCDPESPGGANPLPESEAPEIPELERNDE